MNLTFGICTAGGQEPRIEKMLESIRSECPSPEIIVIGGSPVSGARHIPFDESRPGWITKKKNMIAAAATSPVIVYMHDYIKLCPGWMDSFSTFGDDWDICTNVVRKEDGTRAFDWFAIDYKEWRGPTLVNYDLYSEQLKEYMYPAGNYFLAKKQFMLDHPLDESLVWGQNEDYRWMKANFKSWIYRFNKSAEVQYLKPHHHSPNYSVVISKP